MRRETALVTLSVCLTIIAASAIIAQGGPLDPPNGPVQSTHKTLDQVEPRTPINLLTTPGDGDSTYRITSPGSYYLEGNVIGDAGKFAVEIASSNVAVDLMGHSMIGVEGSLGAFIIDDDLFGTVIHHGSITGWSVGAVVGHVALDSHIHNLNVQDIGGVGILVGAGSTVESCRVTLCDADGISSTQRIVVQACTSRLNGGSGIFAGSGSQIRDCDASNNMQVGISILGEGYVERCVASSNGQCGMSAGDDAVVQACRATANGVDGISAGDNSSITGCTTSSNADDGIVGGTGCVITACIAIKNSGEGIAATSAVIADSLARENIGNGISSLSGGTIVDCSAIGNLNGIYAGEGSIVRSCTASASQFDGIIITSDCQVTQCVSDGNGIRGAGAGIHIPEPKNGEYNGSRIVDNLCTDNTLSVWVETSGNIIVQNMMSGNLVPFNFVNGNEFGDPTNKPDDAGPWANFLY